MSFARPALGALLVGLCGCGVLDAGADASIVTVPGSYHEARMTPGHLAHLNLKGEQQVKCADCHALADAGFESPGPGICAGCHKDEQAQHHPFDGGTQMSCLTCHVFLSKQPIARFEKWACMDCHKEQQGDAGAITVHVQKCESCHRPHLEPFTAAADCTTCHEVTLKHGAKGDTLADKCMNCHPPHTEAAVASAQCVTCHAKPTMTAKARVEPSALFRPGHVGCGSCHQAHTFEKGAVKACKSCHQKQQVLASDAHEGCVSCHPPHRERAAPKPCQSCHRKEVVKHPKDKEGQACLGCHPVHGPNAEEALAAPCVSCHLGPTFTAEVVHAVTTSCDACHKPHDAAPRRDVLCVTCHQDQVTAVKQNKGHAKCEDCHAGLPHGEAETPKPCLSCHKDSQPPQRGHQECASCHASHSAAVVKTCATCHLAPTASKLPGLHAEKKHQDCKSCHAPHTPEPGAGPAICQSCHKKLSLKEHPTAPTQCTGCHLFKAAGPDLTP